MRWSQRDGSVQERRRIAVKLQRFLNNEWSWAKCNEFIEGMPISEARDLLDQMIEEWNLPDPEMSASG